MKARRILIGVLLTSLLIGLLIAIPRSRVSAETRRILSAMQSELAELEASGDDLLTSSNPYNYKALDSYQALVNQGIKALPDYCTELTESKNDGLTGYLLTLAIEDITGADFKNTPYASSTAQAWAEQFERFKEDLPGLVETALLSGDSQRLDELFDDYGCLIYGADSFTDTLADSQSAARIPAPEEEDLAVIRKLMRAR